MYIPLRYGQSKGFPFNLMVAKLVVFDHECVLNYKLEKVRLLRYKETTNRIMKLNDLVTQSKSSLFVNFRKQN